LSAKVANGYAAQAVFDIYLKGNSMTPADIRELLLYAPLSHEAYRKLPSEVQGVWASQPKRGAIEETKQYMRVRVCLLVAGIIYLAAFHVSLGVAWVLICVAALYEFSYYNLSLEKSELDYFLARERYSERVDDLLHKLFPRYEIDD